MSSPDSLLALVRAFCFPGGENAARRIAAVRIAERGEMQTAPKARPIAFTSEQEIDARRSRFRWEARFRGGIFHVVDAYEDGRGRLALRVGILPVRKMTGPDYDRGELQRYLCSLALCPPMLLNHGGLVWTSAGAGVLRVRDSAGPLDATVDLEFGPDGCPVGFSGERPRALGSATVLTPWSGRASEFREHDGLRIPRRTEAFWNLPEGPFRYYWTEVTGFAVLPAAPRQG